MDLKATMERLKSQNEDEIEIPLGLDLERTMDRLFWQDESLIVVDWDKAKAQQAHDRMLITHLNTYRRNGKIVRMRRICKVSKKKTTFQGYSQVNWLRII